MSFIYESIPTQVVAFEVQDAYQEGMGKIIDFVGEGQIYAHHVKDGESVIKGDFVVFLSENDIYRCPKDVFESKYRKVGG